MMKSISRAVIAAAFITFACQTGHTDSIKSSTSWRWTTWTPETGVTPLRWGSPRGDAPAFVLREDTVPTPTETKPVVTIAPHIAPPTTAPAPVRVVAAPIVATPISTPAVAAPAWRLRPEVAAAATSTRPFGYDALIKLDSGPFPQEYPLTSGGAQPWYASPVAAQAFGGTPTLSQREEFARNVVSQVTRQFEQSGINVSLTTDANASAAHTLSVVSATQSPGNPAAVGITDVGRDGFTFVDKLNYANSVQDLTTAVSNNVAHELMHAFGVERHDMSGGYLDSAVADWSTIINPSASFSSQAIGELLARDFQKVGTGLILGAQGTSHAADSPLAAAQQTLAAPVPEPTTWAAWGTAGLVGLCLRRHRAKAKRVASVA